MQRAVQRKRKAMASVTFKADIPVDESVAGGGVLVTKKRRCSGVSSE
jgi:hypothetical protein